MHVKTGSLKGLIDACESRVAGRANLLNVKTDGLEGPINACENTVAGRANLCM